MPAIESNTRPRGEPPSQLEFTRLFVASQAAFQGFQLTLVHDRHAADDLVQELACRLWLKFGDYDAERVPSTASHGARASARRAFQGVWASRPHAKVMRNSRTLAAGTPSDNAFQIIPLQKTTNP